MREFQPSGDFTASRDTHPAAFAVHFAANKLLARACGRPLGTVGREFRFTRPRELVVATTLDQVLPALTYLEKVVARGAFAAGFLAYEAAPAFDPALTAHALIDRPYLLFGVFDGVQVVPPDERNMLSGAAEGPSLEWTPALNFPEYARVLHRIRHYLEAGHTYQVNFTFPLRASLELRDPYAFYGRLLATQPADTAAYIETGRWVIASLSPELFFELDGELVRTRPMKGTMPRGLWSERDERHAAMLASCPKQRAENVMIVDLLRNDLGRISRTGSVEVQRLFEIERYPTVWQMTSSIAARTSASLTRILEALFPCGSVTGAPKVRTMQIIRELEHEPRWIYCGAIGWMAPQRQARFSVAIRTLVIDRPNRRATVHVGSGVVIDSEPEVEYRECLAKAQFLSASPLPPFELLETLLCCRGEFVLLDEHLHRLEASARYFGFTWNRAAVLRALGELAAVHHCADAVRVRLKYSREGTVRLEASPLALSQVAGIEFLQRGVPPAASAQGELPRPSLALARRRVDPTSVLLYHKTTHRDLYHAARQEWPDVDDVLLCNKAGYVTETTIANVVAQLDEELVTPPIECGLLPGVARSVLLKRGLVRERPLTPSDLLRARRVFLVNALRGWMVATLRGESFE